ncbi:MAG: hypothetical protein LBL73_01155, partial [Synergistaceae bacterium]|nr:hypothetical protein [Synergistaceae bacterium]
LQIAVVSHTLNYNLHVGAYGWSRSGGITTISEYWADPATYSDSDYNNASSHGDFGTVLAIAAPDRSLAVGPPAVLQVSGNATPTVIMQAPPRHRDIVSGDFTAGGRSAANPPDALGNSYPDVFSNLGGYSTQYLYDGSSQTISSTTENTDFKIGVKLDTKTSAGVPGIYSVSVSTGLSYANDKATSYTERKTYTTTNSLKANAAADDAIYYNETSYTMWRYPVLAPSWERTTVAADGSEGQAFLQFIVAHSASTQSLPTSGLGLDWYQPNHDVRNLFTYPRDVTKTMGYPAGAGDGIVLGSSSEVYIGAQDAASGQTTFSDTEYTENMSSVENKLGISVGVGAKILDAGDYSLNTTMDDMWKTSSLTSTNASSTQGVTLNWPGMTTAGGTQPYKNLSGFSRTDQAFHAATALYTQDDGALTTAYAVTRLKDTSSSSFLWGRTSPYATTPDPGLLLPFRFNTDSGEHNTSPVTYKLRGMNFDKAIYLDTFPTGVETTGTFRIYNYSFVNTAQPIAWQVLYQKAAVVDGYPEDPDPSKATAISGANGTVPIIAGREYDASSDNWTDVSFKWRAPSVEENGYLHVKLTYSGAQLSVDNDWGHVYVGTYAGYTDSLGARGITADGEVSPADTYEAGPGENLDLRIHGLTVRDVDGNTLDPDALPQNEPFYIDCDVALDSAGEPAWAGTPIVYLELLVNGESAVASQHTPYMPKDTKYRFRVRYDPTLHKDIVELKTLVAEATSHLGVHKSDANPDNHAVTMRFADGSSNGSGSGGCGAGFGLFGMLAFLAALPAVPLATKKKNK